MNAARRPPLKLPRFVAGIHIDLPLLVPLLIICVCGLAVLYSATGGSMDMVWHQALRLALGLVSMVVVAHIPPRWLRYLAPWGLAVGFGLVVAVLWFGDVAGGAQSWLEIGPIRFQPSEILKIVLPMSLAGFLHARPVPPRWSDLGICTVLIAVPVAVVAIEPDLGSAVLIAGAGACVLFFAGFRWRYIFGLLGLVAAVAPLTWFSLHDYQQQRILTFLSPSRDPLGAGYQILQSKIAIGAGGLFGQGWLGGSQTRLSFLPEAHTDFIFAVYTEQTGFFGAAALLFLYILIVGRGLVIALNNTDTFERLTAASLSLMFFLYAFINIAMVSGLLPVVGVPLPLISYGGTSLVTLLTGWGVLMSIQTHRELLNS